LRLLQLFGLGDTSTLLTVGLRRLGVDCDLLLSNRAFVTQYPAWTKQYPELAHGCYTWDKSNTLDPRTIADLYRFVRKYDLIMAHPPAGADAWNFGIPYTMWDGGSGNFIMSTHHESKQLTGKINRELARRSYKHAKWIFFNDINVIYTAWQHLTWAHERYSYMPLPVDTDVFHPMKRQKMADHFIAYLPTRQEVHIKGIDKILQGFKMFTTIEPDAELWITRYGSDVPVTDYFINKFNLQNNIKWVNLVPKQQFAQLINNVDVIIDQASLGALGGVSVQSMACAQRVIVNCHTRWYNEQLGASPPVLQARTPQQFLERLIECTKKKHINLRNNAKRFIDKYFEYNTVAEQVLNQLLEIVS
jgi:glycosyltransferase involved in cell wall biosynthesis